MARDPSTNRYAAQNRKARHDYTITDTIEAGLQLMGSEVKSLRLGRCSINEAFASDRNGEFWLLNAHFPEYEAANRFNHDPNRPRKLLLKKREMNRLIGAIQREGITVVPLSIYFNERGRAKCQLGIAKGRRQVDKRAAIKERDWKRDQARIVRNRGGD
ncbi:SsrA-binding protein [Dongia mobilis]|uniref:SsrA-binding protein n=1 Tax=Dongia mobilis TaxID=578943 RepID=A0A4R6WSD3_9PROT|nr:SsrA-binding protein SmpB [Dongia mobilis]TDQ82527.1 SsrA-binding protein [Dongia mobilis]